MRVRPLLALVLAFCLTFIAAPNSVSASGERGNAKFADIVNTGKANDCPTLSAGSNGSLSIDGGLTDICMHPTEVYVKVAKSKRSKADFAPARIISPRNNTTIEQVYGDVSGSTFNEKGGIDFQLITVLAPNGEEFPFVFSAKEMSVDFKGKSITPGSEANGTTFTPSYRTGDFLDPKSRAKDTGVEYAQGLVALGGDDEELAKENIKRDLTGNGVISLSIDSVDSDTEEFAGSFVAIQPSDNDLGSKEPVDVKIIGELYGRKA